MALPPPWSERPFWRIPVTASAPAQRWSDIVLNATGKAVRDEAELRQVQHDDPGQPIVWHYLSPESRTSRRCADGPRGAPQSSGL